MMQMNLYTKQKATHRLWEWTCHQRGRGGGKEIVREFEIDMYTLLFKIDNQQGPTV